MSTATERLERSHLAAMVWHLAVFGGCLLVMGWVEGIMTASNPPASLPARVAVLALLAYLAALSLLAYARETWAWSEPGSRHKKIVCVPGDWDGYDLTMGHKFCKNPDCEWRGR